MTDLSYSWIHMTDGQLQQVDSEMEDLELFESEPQEIDVPPEFLPPEPDDEDRLPSQIHPSYPYGNPTKAPHPSTSGTVQMGVLGSRALFEDIQVERKGLQTRPNWRDLGLDQLYRPDPERIEAEAAAAARHTNQSNPQAPNNGEAPPQPEGDDPGDDQDEGEEDDEDEDEDEEDLPDSSENDESF